jgi:hypothetical protein
MATPAPGASKTPLLDHLCRHRRRTSWSACPCRGNQEIRCAVLIAKGVAADHDGLRPAWHKARHVLQMIGSRKTTPPRMLRIVPLGERYMRFRPNSSTRASSGVIVAHFTPTPYSLIALAASTVIWSSVLVAFFDAEIVILQVDIEIGVDQLVLDELPDDPGHLIAVEFDDGIGNLDLREHKLVTVCEEAGCPNAGECWSQGHATMMIMGEICTRGCTFCNVATGRPRTSTCSSRGAWPDAVQKLGLNHVVITSVDRDDLRMAGRSISP